MKISALLLIVLNLVMVGVRMKDLYEGVDGRELINLAWIFANGMSAIILILCWRAL